MPLGARSCAARSNTESWGAPNSSPATHPHTQHIHIHTHTTTRADSPNVNVVSSSLLQRFSGLLARSFSGSGSPCPHSEPGGRGSPAHGVLCKPKGDGGASAGDAAGEATSEGTSLRDSRRDGLRLSGEGGGAASLLQPLLLSAGADAGRECAGRSLSCPDSSCEARLWEGSHSGEGRASTCDQDGEQRAGDTTRRNGVRLDLAHLSFGQSLDQGVCGLSEEGGGGRQDAGEGGRPFDLAGRWFVGGSSAQPKQEGSASWSPGDNCERLLQRRAGLVCLQDVEVSFCLSLSPPLLSLSSLSLSFSLLAFMLDMSLCQEPLRMHTLHAYVTHTSHLPFPTRKPSPITSHPHHTRRRNTAYWPSI